MNVSITSRHVEISDPMKHYASSKAARLERFYGHLRKMEVILDTVGGDSYSAELIASAVRGQVIACRAVDETAMAALDRVVDKMERQLTRFKERLQGRAGRRIAQGAIDGENPIR